MRLARLERLSCDVLPASLLPLRESSTLQTTLPNCKADACHGEAHTGPAPPPNSGKPATPTQRPGSSKRGGAVVAIAAGLRGMSVATTTSRPPSPR